MTAVFAAERRNFVRSFRLRIAIDGNTMGAQKRLGRGLDALLGGRDTGSDPATQSITQLPVGQLTPGRFQPRKRIDDETLAELVQSILHQGVLQPLLVRKLAGKHGDVMHEIVAGERRWRAARLAGLKTVPVVLRSLDDQEALAVALIENLQREDLTAIEIAHSLKTLTTDFGLTHKQAAEAVGRSRSAVSNYLRLLDLESSVREFLDSGELDMGHARALLTLDEDAQARLAKSIATRQLSVRDAEELVARERSAAAEKTPTAARPVDLQTRWLQKQFADELGVRVAIRDHGNGKTLKIDFKELPELAASLRKIESLVNDVIDTAGPRVGSQ